MPVPRCGRCRGPVLGGACLHCGHEETGGSPRIPGWCSCGRRAQTATGFTCGHCLYYDTTTPAVHLAAGGR